MNTKNDVDVEQEAFKVCKTALIDIINQNADAKDLNGAFGMTDEEYDICFHSMADIIPKCMKTEKRSLTQKIILENSNSLQEFCLKLLIYEGFVEHIKEKMEPLNPLLDLLKLMSKGK